MTTQHEHSDAAGLAAAVVAVALTMLQGPTPYTLLGAALGLTLLCLIFGYLWDHSRTILQSLTLSSIVGGISILIVCFAIEICEAPCKSELLQADGLTACDSASAPYPEGLTPSRDSKDEASDQTKVSNYWALGTWIIVGLATFVIDRKRQNEAPHLRPAR